MKSVIFLLCLIALSSCEEKYSDVEKSIIKVTPQRINLAPESEIERSHPIEFGDLILEIPSLDTSGMEYLGDDEHLKLKEGGAAGKGLLLIKPNESIKELFDQFINDHGDDVGPEYLRLGDMDNEYDMKKSIYYESDLNSSDPLLLKLKLMIAPKGYENGVGFIEEDNHRLFIYGNVESEGEEKYIELYVGGQLYSIALEGMSHEEIMKLIKSIGLKKEIG